MSTDPLREAVVGIPFEDHHVHQPFKRPHALALAEFRRPFTEATIPAVWEGSLGSHLGYRWLVRELAALLGVAPDEGAVLAARNALDERAYHRLLADHANLGAAYADDLFAAGQCYDIAEWSTLLGRPVYRLLRVETFVEQGYASCPDLDAALERLTREIAATASPRGNLVGLKSIAGYRSGLAIAPPEAEQRRRAALAYAQLREAALGANPGAAERPGRIADKDLVDTIVWTALEAAVPAGLPMQFHVALGDDDIVLARNDPTLLRAILTHPPFRDLPLVLLHCYPYHRHAAYLASLYPNVYVDLGLTIPLVGPGAGRVLAETLELAPVARVLASSDGHGTPEFQWFAILVWRRALARLLASYRQEGILDEGEPLAIAAAILRDNARRIYPVGQSDSRAVGQ